MGDVTSLAVMPKFTSFCGPKFIEVMYFSCNSSFNIKLTTVLLFRILNNGDWFWSAALSSFTNQLIKRLWPFPNARSFKEKTDKIFLRLQLYYLLSFLGWGDYLKLRVDEKSLHQMS
jgi:hypothetical protein